MNEEPLRERHPLEPFLPEGARLLMLGSFPPARSRWSMEFYYPNAQNDMWRIMGLLFFGDREHFVASGRRGFDRERVQAFCAAAGIALSDTVREAVRLKGNASDAALQVVEPLDLHALLAALPACRAVAVTGGKAADTLLPLVECEPPAVGCGVACRLSEREFTLYRMPSTSRAYPLPLERKAEAYGRMLRETGILP